MPAIAAHEPGELPKSGLGKPNPGARGALPPGSPFAEPRKKCLAARVHSINLAFKLSIQFAPLQDSFVPFEMDDEFVRHALVAVTVPEPEQLNIKSATAPSSGSKRVDIRTLKKKKRAKEEERTRIR